jgi:hypothetical protein
VLEASRPDPGSNGEGHAVSWIVFDVICMPLIFSRHPSLQIETCLSLPFMYSANATHLWFNTGLKKALSSSPYPFTQVVAYCCQRCRVSDVGSQVLCGGVWIHASQEARCNAQSGHTHCSCLWHPWSQCFGEPIPEFAIQLCSSSP